VLALLALVAACNRGHPPALFEVDDQVAVVGQPLVVQLVASDPEGDSLTFGFAGPAVPDLAGTAAITRTPDGQGIFTFTPLASQVGQQVFDLWASDGHDEDHVPLFVEVRQSAGAGTLPVFGSPLGAGTVLDLEQTDCLGLDIEVEDPDSTSIVLDQVPPLIEGASLSATPNGHQGAWNWCPDRRQIDTSDRYTLRLRADDGDNPAVTKEFVIVLRRPAGDQCPGEAPVIEHAPVDVTTRLDPAITAEIGDDLGLGTQPYLVWATEDPGDPIDFDKTTLVPMELAAGDLQAGTWVGQIPNPVANAPDGTAMPIYYLLSATDDDDADGYCDHRTDDPDGGMHRITITAGGDEAVGICEPCSFDVQCGGEGDLCLPAAAGGAGGADGRCGQACAGDDECDEGYACSPTALESVEGQLGRQCIPQSGSCDGPAGGCEDDDHEPDGTPAEASDQAELGEGSSGGRVLCGGDEDWYVLPLGEPTHVTASLEGDVPPDLDLSLTTAVGVLLDASEGLSSSELVEGACLEPGTYLVRVYSIDAEPAGEYVLELELSACMGDDDGCCVAHAAAGCSDAAVETCVCAVDPFCCSTQWDATCVDEVASESCGACP